MKPSYRSHDDPSISRGPALSSGRLRILGTSDLHMHLRSFDYFADKPKRCGSMTRIATLMKQARRQSEARGDVVVALDNGDGLQGTPLEELALREHDEPHIFYRSLRLMGYDAAGLGNHDFNFDLNNLAECLTDAPIPILCTNARRVDGADLPVEKWIMLRRTLAGAPLNIGVFSLLPPQTLVWDADHLVGRLVIDDIVASARATIETLQANGSDIIIALAHTGLGESQEKTGQENALWPLSKLEGLHAIIAGHTHLQLPDPNAPLGSDLARGLLHGTPVIMPGAGGDHLGVIDLDLSHGASGWGVKNAHPHLRPALAPEDPDLVELTAPLHQATRDHLAHHVGYSPIPLHSYFSFLAPSPALALVAAANARALRMFLKSSLDLPLLSSVAPARMGGRGGPGNFVEIPAGPLSMRHVFDLCFFPNRLAAVIVTGAQLADWIEMSAGLYNRIQPGQPTQSLIDMTRPAHASDVFYGVEYELDLSQPARFDADGDLMSGDNNRLTKLEHLGKPVAPDDRFIVAVSSYRANGGGNVRALASAERVEIPRLLVRDALRDYLQSRSFPDWANDAVFRFRPLGRTSVSARTGPGAARFLDDIKDIYERVRGTDEEGFLEVQLTL